MDLQPSNKIRLSESKIPNAGRGIFATVGIKKDELIERCPILYLSEKDSSLATQTVLLNYYFLNEPRNRAAVCLGYGSLYNHSYEPNATYKKLLDDGWIDFVAIKEIEPGDEITVNYNYGNPTDKTRLWIKEVPPYEEK